MNRKIYYWKLRESEMQLGERTIIMGVLNVTPDSFSDGGRFNDPDRAYARAMELEEQGADIIDIGAESTKPGSTRISSDEEWQRLVPVLKRLRGNLRVPLSLDTYKAEIAERALQYGVEIFNDPSGLTFDPNLAKVVAVGNAGLILNHMRGQPDTWAKLPPMQDPMGTITRELEATISRARHAGVDKARIVIDPGLGFGKRKEQNSEILAHLKQLGALDYPILVGPSRKHFLAQAAENDTLFATAAAVTAAILNGAYIVRVHDVKEMLPVVHVADEIAATFGMSERLALAAEERQAARAKVKSGLEVEIPRVRPTRPPLQKPVVVVAPVEAEKPETAMAGVDEELPEGAVAEATAEAGTEATPETATDATPTEAPKPAFVKSAFPPAKPAFQKFDRPQGDRFQGPPRGDGNYPPRRPPTEGGFDRRSFEKPSFDRRDSGPRDSGPPRREFRPAAGPGGFRPSGPRPPFRDDRGPRPPFRPAGDRPDSGGPPRRDFRSDGPPRRDFRSDGPPRRDFNSDGPPRRDFRPAAGPGGFRPSGPRPPFRDDRGPRPPFRPAGDRPDSGGPPRRDFRSDGPPRRDFRSDGPPRPDSRPDGPPRRDFRAGGPPPPRRDFRPGGPPRGNDRPGSGGPPRPFRKRP